MVPLAAQQAPRAVLSPELLLEGLRDLKWVGRKVVRAYKKKRPTTKPKGSRKKAQRIGENVGSGNSRLVHTYSSGLSSISSDTLFNHEIALPQEGTTPAQRNRNLINLRGIKLCAEFNFPYYSASTAEQTTEWYLNCAVVVDKKDPIASGVTGTRFFRDSAGTDRGIDFAAVPDSLGKACLPINSDQYIVFFKKRYLLGAHPSQNSNSVLVDQYIPIDRQIRFTETNQPDTKFYFVYWFNRVGTTGVVPAVRGTIQYRHITYFKQTCEC